MKRDVDADRRRLLGLSALGLGALVLPGLGCAGAASSMRAGALGEGSRSFELEGISILELGQWMREGRETSRSLVMKYLGRIEALDRQGPLLRAVLETNPDALAVADALDAERRDKGPRGPLHGVPILLKDNLDTADRMSTTAGSLALYGYRAARDATVVARLRAAGAVLLGKTNMSEWANIRSTHSVSGWSSRGGQCRNPYALDRNASGSSSGSAAAIAASFAAASVGTETDGSITSPASVCSLVGLKPTVGLLGRGGIIPVALSQDTAGPIGRSVADVAVLLGAMVGEDERDPLSKLGAEKGALDYTRFLDPNGLKGARIGVVREKLWGANAKVDRLLEAALLDLKRLGATLVDPANIPTIGELWAAELEVLLTELRADLNAYLGSMQGFSGPKSLAELIAWNEAHAASVMPLFGQELFEMAQKKGDRQSSEYQAAFAKARRLARDEGLDVAFEKAGADVLVAPTGPLPWLIDPVMGDHIPDLPTTSPPAIAGYPHITVPAGYVNELPVGLSFIGKPFTEAVLIRMAYAYEQATKHRRAPKFLPSAPIG